MATSGTYYLNGPTLSSATAVFTDAALSICAPDGFYSDGSIVREQVSCSLLPEVICPACAVPCNTNINGTGGQGVYYIDTDTGINTGAIIIRFQPFGIPDGILIQLGPNVYNGMSSSNYGWLQGSAGLPTYVGEIASDCGILAGSPYPSVNEFKYEGSGFVSLGTTTSVTVLPGQVELTTNPPGVCTIVVPKTSNSFTILNTQIIGLCSGTGFDIEVECPQSLSTWSGSILAATAGEACLLGTTITYYYVHVNGSSGVFGLYDMVFSDPNGQNPLPAGFYNTGSMSPSFNWVEVDSNGVIISFGLCTTATRYIVERCYTSDQEIISVTGTLTPGQRVILAEHPGCIWEVVSTTSSAASATFVGITTDPCTEQCASWQVVNNNLVVTNFVFEDCDGNSYTFELGASQSVTVCGRQILVSAPGLDISVVDCECSSINEVWQLQGCCNNDIVNAVPLISVAPGDLVKVSDTTLFDCWYEVIALTFSNPTTTITTKNASISCSDVCCKYQVCNGDSVNHTVSYTNCDGTPYTISIPPGVCITVCARANSFSPYSPLITVTFDSCTC
jgi:hypothetical protein